MKSKKLLFAVVLVLLLAVFVTPVMAMGLAPDPVDPVSAFNAVFLAVAGAVGFGSLTTLLIQVGKIFLPKLFPDGSAGNWRLLFVLIGALILYLAPMFGWSLDFAGFDKVSAALASLGATLSPLFVWLADWISQKFYAGLLQGRALIGKSYSVTNAKAAKAPPKIAAKN